LRITRFPSLTEQQFMGCISAFNDSFTGELNAAVIAMRRLEGQRKGSAFAFEMTLDNHRYGALIVLDRWSTVGTAYAGHLENPLLEGVPARVAAAEKLLAQVNNLIDGSASYSTELIEACQVAFQTLAATFAGERESAERNAKLGPMLPEDYTTARQIFLQDLAAR